MDKEELVIKELGLMGFIKSFQWKRFKDFSTLKQYIEEVIKNDSGKYELLDLKEKEDIDNKFQDYEINGTLENEYFICDFTFWYAKTRANEILITETNETIEYKVEGGK